MIFLAISRIWEKIFEDAGESGLEGKVQRCPGESCEQFKSRFPKTKGSWKDRAEECVAGCGKCNGNIPLKPNRKVKTDDVSELLDEIEDIILWENAGHSIDWIVYPFDFQILHRHWRQAESNIKEIREIRMQSFLKGWFKE